MLDPDIAALLAQLNAALPALETLSPTEARTLLAAMGRTAPPGPALASVRDIAVPAPTGPIGLRVYRDTATPAGILVYFHGGGWTVGSLDSVDAVLRDVAKATGFIICSVDYRLAPEAPFPAALDDALAAVAFVDAHIRANDRLPLVIGGDSAGANLATVTAVSIRDCGGPHLAGQLLFYPVTDADLDTPSYLACGDGYFLTRSLMAWFWQQYLPDPSMRRDVRAAPLRAGNLSGLPPALIQTAEFDPLRSEGEAYARRLEAAGSPVDYDCRPGLTHGYVGFRQVPAARQAVARAGEWLRRIAPSDPRSGTATDVARS